MNRPVAENHIHGKRCTIAMARLTNRSGMGGLILPMLFLLFPIFSACEDDKPLSDREEFPGADTEPPDPIYEHIQFLAMLDVDVFSPRPPLDRFGKPLPESWHPLGRSTRAFRPQMELYVAGLEGVITGEQQGIVDYNKESGALSTKLYSEAKTDSLWVGDTPFKRAAAGDVDGDGHDEILVTWYNRETKQLLLRHIDYNRGVAPKGQPQKIWDIAAATIDNDTEVIDARPCMATGDLDGDGLAEVLVTFFDTLYILDDSTQSFSPLDHNSFGDGDDGGLCVSAGDYDGDNLDEFVLTYSRNHNAYYGVFDGSLSTPFAKMKERQAVSGSLIFSSAAAASGDVDGDGLDEIVLAGRTSPIEVQTREKCEENELKELVCTDEFDYNYCTKSLNVIDDAQNGFATTAYVFSREVQGPDTVACNTFSARTVDFDGDNLAEIFDGRVILDDVTRYGQGNGDTLWPKLHDMPSEAISVATGDLNQDFREDIVYTDIDHIMRMVASDSNNAIDVVQEWPDAGAYGAVVAANVDTDSPVLSSIADGHELLYSDPIILAVIASPPFWEGSQQVGDKAKTSFGTLPIEAQSGNDPTTKNSAGLTVGPSVSYGDGTKVISVDLANFEFAPEFETSLDMHLNTGKTLTRWGNHDCPAGEDRVVFAVIPMNVYYYQVVCANKSSFKEGDIISVNVPGQPQILSISKQKYFQNNGKMADEERTLPAHEIGNPFSYPDAGKKNELLKIASAQGQGYQTGPVYAKPDIGSIQLLMKIVASGEYGQDIHISRTVATTAGAEKLKKGEWGAFSYGFSYELNTGQGMSFDGSVEYNSRYQYETGFFVYPDENRKVVVVTYWVDR